MASRDTEPDGGELSTVRVPEKLVPSFREAQRYVERYFADQRSAPERGTLEISGQRYMLVRAASMSVEFHDMVKSFYAEEREASAVAHALLFDVAHAMGLADGKTFAERMNVRDPIARLSAGPVHFAHAGWAFVDISPESSPSGTGTGSSVAGSTTKSSSSTPTVSSGPSPKACSITPRSLLDPRRLRASGGCQTPEGAGLSPTRRGRTTGSGRLRSAPAPTSQ